MPFPKLAEGNRVFDAVADTAALAAQINALQDQLKAMCGPRRIRCSRLASHMSWLEWTKGGVDGPDTIIINPDAKSTTVAPGTYNEVYFEVPLYVGQKITSIGAIVTGTAGALDGAIEFFYRTAGGVVHSAIDLDGVANCWDTGGEAYANAVTYSTAAAPLPITVVDGFSACFKLTRPSNPAAAVGFVWDAYVIAQFGN